MPTLALLGRYSSLLLAALILVVVPCLNSKAAAAPAPSRSLTVRIHQRTIAPLLALDLSGQVPTDLVFPRLGSMTVTVVFRAAGSEHAVTIEKTRLDFDGCPETLAECVGYPAYIDRGKLAFPILARAPKQPGYISITASNLSGDHNLQLRGSVYWRP